MKSYILKNVNDELWRKVKVIVARKEISIRQLIIDSLKREVRQEELSQPIREKNI